MRIHRWLASLSIALGVVVAPVAMSACLSDIGEATSCPPAAQHTAEACTKALEEKELQGCFTYEGLDSPSYYECLSGPRSTCDCTPGECPTDDAACFPPGDCPPEVKKVAPNAQCLRLQDDDFGMGGPQISQCLCGCFACVSVCDGKGPVFGVLDPGELPGHVFTYQSPVIDLERYMPSHGSIGYYIRARGISNVQVVTVAGDITDEKKAIFSGYYMTTPLDNFGDQVFYKDSVVDTDTPYTWTSEADKPKILELALAGGATEDNPQLAIYEIDCIIPFLVPD